MRGSRSVTLKGSGAETYTMQAIYVPSIPPVSAFEAYLLLLIVPFVFRLVMAVSYTHLTLPTIYSV